MGFKVRAGNEKILTLISKETVVSGTLHGSGPVRIDGRVQGEVDIDGEIIIGEDAVVEAAVKGRNIQVAGRVTGNIFAGGRLEIMSTGIVKGDVDVESLLIADGAVFHGACVMRKPETTA